MTDEHMARALYGALDGRQVSTAAPFLVDASRLHVSGESGLAGDYQGRQAILGLLRQMGDLTGGTLRFDPPSSVTATGRTVVLLGHVAATRPGRQLDSTARVAVTLAGEELRQLKLSCLDQSGYDDFWS